MVKIIIWHFVTPSRSHVLFDWPFKLYGSFINDITHFWIPFQKLYQNIVEKNLRNSKVSYVIVKNTIWYSELSDLDYELIQSYFKLVEPYIAVAILNKNIIEYVSNVKAKMHQ